MKQARDIYMGLILGTLIYAAFSGLEREETIDRCIILTAAFLLVSGIIGIARLFRKRSARHSKPENITQE